MLSNSGAFTHTLSSASNESTQTLADRKNAILLIEHFPVSVLRVSTGVRFQLLSLLAENYVRKNRSPSHNILYLQYLANLPNSQLHPMHLMLF